MEKKILIVDDEEDILDTLTYKIIDYHKGKINVKSKVGQGTEVIVRLPIIRDKEK